MWPKDFFKKLMRRHFKKKYFPQYYFSLHILQSCYIPSNHFEGHLMWVSDMLDFFHSLNFFFILKYICEGGFNVEDFHELLFFFVQERHWKNVRNQIWNRPKHPFRFGQPSFQKVTSHITIERHPEISPLIWTFLFSFLRRNLIVIENVDQFSISH